MECICLLSSAKTRIAQMQMPLSGSTQVKTELMVRRRTASVRCQKIGRINKERARKQESLR